MRTEQEVRELHGYLMAAWELAKDDDVMVTEADQYVRMCDLLAWCLGHGDRFTSVVESGRKVVDDAALTVTVLDD